MRYLLIIILLGLYGCADLDSSKGGQVGALSSDSVVVPEVIYLREDVVQNRMNSLWISPKDSSLVSGYIMQYYPDGSLANQFGVFEGKREGVSKTYFQSGELKFLESYSNNKLHGTVKRWTTEPAYQLIAELQYEAGKLHGEQKKWYNTGELHKRLNLENGKEEGMQQAFRKNGALYANYEARNGRVFGLKRSNLCYELENEQVVYYQ